MSLLDNDSKDNLLLACRYGDLEDVQAFVNQHGSASLNEIRDENGNSILHMISANGHHDLLNFLLPLVSSDLLSTQNISGSTPLHWAAVNTHFGIAQKLVLHPSGPGRDLIDIKNKAGLSPLGEAEFIGWDDGAKWFVEMMTLDPESPKETPADEDALDIEHDESHDVDFEIQDADGRMAKMTLSPNTLTEPSLT